MIRSTLRAVCTAIVFAGLLPCPGFAGPQVVKVSGMAPGSEKWTHIFSAGGHGFGLKKQGASSDHWIDEFYGWLEAQKLIKPAADR